MHEWINSLFLAILTIAFFIQGNVLKYMKTAMEAIDMGKVKAASEYIAKGEEMKYKALMNQWILEQTDIIATQGASIDKLFTDRYTEMIGATATMISMMPLEKREGSYGWFPLCEPSIRKLVKELDQKSSEQGGSTTARRGSSTC